MAKKNTEEKWYGVKFLIPYLKPYKVKIIFIFLAMVGVAVTSALSAYMMKPILNNIFVAKDEYMLKVIPFLIILLFVTRGAFRFLSTYLADTVGVAVTKQIREEMFAKAIEADYATISKMTVGDINAHIIQTVLNLRNIIVKTIPKFLVNAMTIVAIVGMTIYLNWKLSLIAVVFASVIVYPVKYLGKKVKSHVSSAEKMISGLTDRVNETFNHLDLVRLYDSTELEKEDFKKVLSNYQRFQLKLAKYQEATSPIMEFFVSLAIASVVFLGGLLVFEDEMTVGDFFAFLTALLMIYGPMKIVTKNVLVLNILDTYIKRIEKILNLKQETISNEIVLDKEIETIEFKNVSLSIGKKKILQDLNFTINKGDIVAFVGKTGAGKSSMLSLMFGFRNPTKGEVLINGIDVSKIDKVSLRKQFSYVNQSAGIFNTTVRDNVTYGLKYQKEKFEKAIELAHCEFIDELPKKEQTNVGENGKKLSGGQRQRLALARAIYKDGDVFILDEATSALDANTEQMIQNSLESIMEEKTTILIAHRLHTIQNASKVMVLKDGKIVEYGDYESVAKSDAFKENFAIKDEGEK